MTLDEYCAAHKANPQGFRLGQRFANEFIKQSEPGADGQDLYYVENDLKAKEKIRQWMANHCYQTIDQIPKVSRT